MSVNIYQYGDAVRCSTGTGGFTDSAGTAIDPMNVYFSVKNPVGITTTYTYGVDTQLVKDATGKYHVDVNANLVGAWFYRFYSDGTGQAADESSFRVAPSEFD